MLDVKLEDVDEAREQTLTICSKHMMYQQP